MERPKPKTYEAKVNGRKTRVTVPDDPDPEEMLIDAIQDSLSPQAVAAIAAFLQPAATKSAEVNRQIRWFAELLTAVVGGGEAHNRLCEEVGL